MVKEEECQPQERRSNMSMKTTLEVIQANSLRDIVNYINSHNSKDDAAPILREDILKLYKEDGCWMLVYYK